MNTWVSEILQIEVVEESKVCGLKRGRAFHPGPVLCDHHKPCLSFQGPWRTSEHQSSRNISLQHTFGALWPTGVRPRVEPRVQRSDLCALPVVSVYSPLHNTINRL